MLPLSSGYKCSVSIFRVTSTMNMMVAYFCDMLVPTHHSTLGCNVEDFLTTVKDECVIFYVVFNPLKAELNPTHHLLPLEGAHHFVHVSRIRVNIQIYKENLILHDCRNARLKCNNCWYCVHLCGKTLPLRLNY
jgi:uncharacterized membrane protein